MAGMTGMRIKSRHSPTPTERHPCRPSVRLPFTAYLSNSLATENERLAEQVVAFASLVTTPGFSA
jgi:hypothetical protein